jgi:hypothetical protein
MRNKVNPFVNQYSPGGLIEVAWAGANVVGNTAGNHRLGQKAMDNKVFRTIAPFLSPVGAAWRRTYEDIKAQEALDAENKLLEDANNQSISSIVAQGLPQQQNQVLNIDQMYQQGIMAHGGIIPDSTKGSMFTSNDFTSFDTGGLHEQNPYGGIPQGTGENGKMNTVEEGETSFKTKQGKYIFSNRLRYTPQL